MSRFPKKVIFLYTELAEYFLVCVRELAKEGIETHIVRWSVNEEAPFDFQAKTGVFFYNRSTYSKSQLFNLVSTIQPDLIVCSGWIDKNYLHICRKYKGKIPTVLISDNHWRNTLKQKIGKVFKDYFIHNKFSDAWVPGEPQKEFVRKLGFKNYNISTGFYSADFSHFYRYYEEFKEYKLTYFPKRFIYVGRYMKHKGIFDLWTAFVQLKKEQPNDWELWCLGTGKLFDKRIEHPDIKHFGFVQPKDIGPYLKETGVFVLPSHFEPWGVVVHEFAAAGFPLICSNKVGAASQFLQESSNGFSYQAGNVQKLKDVMRQVINTSAHDLMSMGAKSTELAKTITPQLWTQNLLKILDKAKTV
ncbi:MAG: glycosyl transferase family 1 [Flavobacteriales bacterium]|nr:MAG: glycosyl transferase family 1 [Flavobacteriales bacterium]